jgi:hypothetical protein
MDPCRKAMSDGDEKPLLSDSQQASMLADVIGHVVLLPVMCGALIERLTNGAARTTMG